MDRHTCPLSTETIAQARQAARTLLADLSTLSTGVHGTAEVRWGCDGNPTPISTVLRATANPTAHTLMANAAHQQAVFDAVARWGAGCPLLWSPMPDTPGSRMAPIPTQMTLTIAKGRVKELGLTLPHPLKRSSHILSCPVGPKGVELLRLATILGTIQGPFFVWNTTANVKEETFYAGGLESVAIMDRLVRAARTTLKGGKANTPPSMRYTQVLVPYDAQCFLDHTLDA